MKILYLYLFPLYGNGSASFLREVSQRIAQNHEVAILSPDKRAYPHSKHYEVHTLQNGVFVGHPEWKDVKQFGQMDGRELGDLYTTYLWSTIQAVNDFKPDVIHVFHTVFLPSIAKMIKAFYGTKYIVTTHGSDLEYFQKDKRLMHLMKDANKEARYITACSDFTKKMYIRMFGESVKRKMVTIVGGVDTNNYQRDLSLIDKINEMYDLVGKNVVLFTGRLTKHKGVTYLIKAAKHIDGTILIIGDGPERARLEDEVAALKVANVQFLGYINNKEPIYHAFYERADVYVAPSIWNEPFGLTIIEAMAAHTPVVASKSGGVVSIITHKQNGILVLPRSAAAIAKEVNALLHDRELQERISMNAYATVLEKFNWDTIARKFEMQYEEIVGKKQTSKEELPLESFFRWIFAREQYS